MMNYSVSLTNGKVTDIKYNGKSVELDSLVGTPVWDKVNNVVTLSSLLRQSTGKCVTCYVTDDNYQTLVSSWVRAISAAQSVRKKACKNN